ncbi:hypothetical protein Nekkels1_3 [Cellulophaga phage Nekkels_1]|uniref:Uncharacterized protein n=1 Tax=Cellulophaga phage Nekkels_1 TaxID=2745692 RepID=A0A8E4UXH4_9CAUD|nr:hypothetical protein M1M31_gp03 [Cellulophaga phage Nekkels_1]QQO97030.1 hypothetical protein Nekkels1_3 [Cellulophaga phage Nekkels_1]QQO97123.1 hypothetical protein Nekkels2_3 [Cellulophaga phage Nekkels_2]
MNEQFQEYLVEYIEWLSKKEDVFYAFDDPKKAAKEFQKHRMETHII